MISVPIVAPPPVFKCLLGTKRMENICFCNKPMTVRIWGWVHTHQHWGSDAALQLPKQLVPIISQGDYPQSVQSVAPRWLALSLARGAISSHWCLVRQSMLASWLCLELIPGFRRALGGPSSLLEAMTVYRRDAGPCHRAEWEGVKGPVPKPSSVTGTVLLGSGSEGRVSKVLTLLEEPHSPH